MHPFSGVRWWPALLLAGGGAVVVAAAYAVVRAARLRLRRPGGATRAGRARRGLPDQRLGLAWRLQRGSVLGWTAGLFLAGLAYGSIGDDVGDTDRRLAGSHELFVQGGADIVDGFYGTSILMLAVIGSGLRDLLGAAAARRGGQRAARGAAGHRAAAATWLLGHVVVTVGGTCSSWSPRGSASGVGFAVVTGDGDAVAPSLGPVPYVAPGAGAERVRAAALRRGAAARRGAWPGAARVRGGGDALRRCLPAAAVAAGRVAVRAPRAVPAEDFRLAPFLALVASRSR